MTNELDTMNVYLADLDGIPSNTVDQRLILHAAMSSPDPVIALSALRVLWADACKFVVVIEARIRKAYGIEHADPDMIQEGNIAASAAVESWDPDQGAFSTWVGRVVSGAMLDYLNESNKGGVGSKSADMQMVNMHDTLVVSNEQTGDEDRPGMRGQAGGLSRGELLTYRGVSVGDELEGTDSVPEGFDVPEREVYRLQLREAIDQIRCPLDKQILSEYYGFDGPAKTLAELGKDLGYSPTGVRKRLQSAEEKVKKFL